MSSDFTKNTHAKLKKMTCVRTRDMNALRVPTVRRRNGDTMEAFGATGENGGENQDSHFSIAFRAPNCAILRAEKIDLTNSRESRSRTISFTSFFIIALLSFAE